MANVDRYAVAFKGGQRLYFILVHGEWEKAYGGFQKWTDVIFYFHLMANAGLFWIFFGIN